MDKVIKLENVDLYNSLYGLETLHPLVSIVDLTKATKSVNHIQMNYGLYALFLKETKSCDIKYGRQYYDYQEGTIVCFGPGQTASVETFEDEVSPPVYGIVFHPDLIRGTSLGKEIKKYTKTKNVKKVKNKCNKLASEYLENNRIWNLQENWYCLLAYFITIATMILRCIDVKTKTNDWISLAMYFAVSGLWIIIVKTKRFMGLKAESFLIAFNNNAPSLTIVSSLFFYTVVCTCTCRYIWIAVIVLTFFGCMSLTYLWYKREKIYMHI